jgi:heme/copper-type cytochrome/quinol oxidase subunit 4
VSRTILPVWLTTLALAVVVGVVARETFMTWLPVALAAVVLLTFVIQLLLSRKEELVTRMIFSIGGALVILVAATVVLALLFPVRAIVA